jgi:single-stranded DNA-binding protein
MSGIESAFFGVLADDAQSKTSKSGKPYLRMRVRVGDGDSVQWVGVMSFDGDAIGMAEGFRKGARVYCEGSLKQDEWTGNDGVQRHGLTVLSFHTRLAQIGRNKPAKRDGEPKPARELVLSSSPQAPSRELNDEIPF